MSPCRRLTALNRNSRFNPPFRNVAKVTGLELDLYKARYDHDKDSFLIKVKIALSYVTVSCRYKAV